MEIIEIKEEIRILQDDCEIILEKGDRIEVLNEGATDFSVVMSGSSMADAYAKAVADAVKHYGSNPYNGTISTTSGFKEMGLLPPAAGSSEYRAWENQMLSQAEKWGKALGFPLGDDRYLFIGWAAT